MMFGGGPTMVCREGGFTYNSDADARRQAEFCQRGGNLFTAGTWRENGAGLHPTATRPRSGHRDVHGSLPAGSFKPPINHCLRMFAAFGSTFPPRR